MDFQLYRFSSIKNQAGLVAAVHYVVNEARRMGSVITGDALPVGAVTVFAHYPDEFEELQRILLSLGALTHQNNGPFVRLHEPIQVGGANHYRLAGTYSRPISVAGWML